MKFVNKTIKLLCLVPILIGIFSLSNFAHSRSQCEIDEYSEIDKYSLLSYLVNSDKVCGKFISGSNIVSVIKVLDAYWDQNTTNEGRFKLLSDDYKNIIRKVHGLKNESEYSIPSAKFRFHSNASKPHFSGYHIMRIQSYRSGALGITMKVKWLRQGGHRGGTMTYIFDMVKVDDTWGISWIHQSIYTVNW